MRELLLTALIALLIGCSSGLTEQRVEQDFRSLIAAEYKTISIEEVQRIDFGDGWDDGAETRIYFKASCMAPATATECKKGPMQMQMSYQKNSAGHWEVLSAEVLAAE